jgi:peptidoglycan/LPS O-acetylase OafA/YrhL
VATAETRSAYMKQLDGLRAIAVAMVIVSHFPPIEGFDKLLPWGQLGVELFFVLSGFLITGILLRCRDDVDRGLTTNGSGLRAFYLRRSLRIFPVYYLTLLFLSIWNIADARAYVPYHATYLTNFYIAVTGQNIGDTTHFWSLAVEEQFYLVWPWVILFTPRRRLLPVILGFMACGPLYRLVTGYLHWNVFASLWIPAGNLHTLCGGALLASLSHDHRLHAVRERITRVGGVVGLLGVLALLAANVFHVPVRYSVSLVATGLVFTPLFMAVIDLAARGRTGVVGRVLEARPVVYLGQISYCVYIVHFLMPAIFDRLAESTGASWLAASQVPIIRLLQMSLSTVAIAALSMTLVERPLSQLKARFRYDAPSQPATAVATPGTSRSASG